MKKIIVSILVLSLSAAIACERKNTDYAGASAEQSTSPEYEANAQIAKVRSDATIDRLMPGYAGGKIDGKALFAKNCSACHQLTGQGVPGVFPPLDGSPYALQNDERMASIMIYGLQGPINVNGTQYNSVMAPLGGQMDDKELAAVATYVRTAWSNKGEPVEEGIFTKMREKWGSRSMFTIAELGEEK